jgi:ATP-dependent DNA helicase HFM1/MER3
MLRKKLFNRRPPFGYDILECLRQFPQYKLNFIPTSVESRKGKGPVEVDLDIECGLMQELAKSNKKGRGRMVEMTSVLTMTSDNEYIDYRRIP